MMPDAAMRHGQGYNSVCLPEGSPTSRVGHGATKFGIVRDQSGVRVGPTDHVRGSDIAGSDLRRNDPRLHGTDLDRTLSGAAALRRLEDAVPRSAWAGDRQSFAVPVTTRNSAGV